MDKKDFETLSKLAVEWYTTEVGGDELPKQIKDFCTNPVFLCKLVNVVAQKNIVDLPDEKEKGSSSVTDKIGEALDALEITFEASLADAKPEVIASGNENAVLELLYSIAQRWSPDCSFVESATGIVIPPSGFSFPTLVRKSPVTPRRKISRGTKTVGAKPSHHRPSVQPQSQAPGAPGALPVLPPLPVLDPSEKDVLSNQEKRRSSNPTPRNEEVLKAVQSEEAETAPQNGVPITPRKQSRFGRMFHWKSPSEQMCESPGSPTSMSPSYAFGKSVTPREGGGASYPPLIQPPTTPQSSSSSSSVDAFTINNAKDADPSLGSSKRGWTGDSFPAWFKKSLNKAVEVNLSLNMLSQVPPLIFQNCKDCLRSVDLSGNRITTISERIADLKSITSLNLDRNALESLPPAVFAIPGLKTLSARHCGLKSIVVPADADPRPPLTVINLDYNEMSSLPDELKEFKFCRNLNLSHNLFTEIPKVIAFIRKTTELDLSWNSLTTVSETWTQNALCCASIIRLDLSNNQIVSLPESLFAALPRLARIDISNNRLTSLPESLANLPKLRYLNIAGNLFTESINLQPALDSLVSLNVSRNRLTVLPNLSNCRMIDSFYGSFNPLTSPPLALPSTLTHLNLNGCGLKELNPCALTNLRVMNLAGNHFTEVVLDGLVFHNIQSADVSRNRLKSIPSSLCSACSGDITPAITSSNNKSSKSSSRNSSQVQVVDVDVDWSDNEFVFPLRTRVLTGIELFDKNGMKLGLAESHTINMEDLVIAAGNFAQSEDVHFFSLVCSSGKTTIETFPSVSQGFCVLLEASLKMQQAVEEAVIPDPTKIDKGSIQRSVYRTMGDSYEQNSDGTIGAEVVFAIVNDSTHRMTVCSAGNCRAILSRKGEPVVLSRWLDPLSPEEYVRIVGLGSYVTEDGLIGGCCSSAYAVGFGKLRSDHVIAAELSLMEIELDAEQDEFLILSSSSLWTCITHERAVEVVHDAIGREASPAEIAAELREWAAECGLPHTSVAILFFPGAFKRSKSSSGSSRGRSRRSSHKEKH